MDALPLDAILSSNASYCWLRGVSGWWNWPWVEWERALQHEPAWIVPWKFFGFFGLCFCALNQTVNEREQERGTAMRCTCSPQLARFTKEGIRSGVDRISHDRSPHPSLSVTLPITHQFLQNFWPVQKVRYNSSSFTYRFHLRVTRHLYPVLCSLKFLNIWFNRTQTSVNTQTPLANNFFIFFINSFVNVLVEK